MPTPTPFRTMTENPSAESAFGSSPSHDPFQAAKASALKAAEELRAAAAQKASEFRSAAESRAQQFRSSAEQTASDFKEKASDIKERAGDFADQTLNEARVRYDDLRAEAEKFAREKPLQALLTAFGIGFVVGAILRR